MRITILGGTGYAGRHIAAEAAARGHDVTSFSRTAPAEPIDGVQYRHGSVTDPAVLRQAIEGAEVVIGSLSPRPEMAGQVRPTYAALAEAVRSSATRILIVGGAGSLLSSPDGPRLVDGDFAPEYLDEALELADVLDDLRAGEGVDWTFVSPAEIFGPWAAGERTGEFRTGGDVVLRDADGASAIGAEDFATAVVDELEQPKHRGARFTVAY